MMSTIVKQAGVLKQSSVAVETQLASTAPALFRTIHLVIKLTKTLKRFKQKKAASFNFVLIECMKAVRRSLDHQETRKRVFLAIMTGLKIKHFIH